MQRPTMRRWARLRWLVLLGATPVLLTQCAPRIVKPLPLDPLSVQEREVAERVARADPRTKELLGQRARLSYVEFLAVKPPNEASLREEPGKPIQAARHAEVVFYRFDDDSGIRAVVALEPQPALVEVARIDAANVPLNNQDLEEARQMVLADPTVRSLLGRSLDEVRVEGLPIRGETPDQPCYRRRCLQLFFRIGNDYLADATALVDLTARTVSVERRKP